MQAAEHPVFQGIGPEELAQMQAMGGIRTRTYPKGSTVFHRGERTRVFGIVKTGTVHVESTDLWGNRVILHGIGAGQAFAETYAFCGVPMMADVTAARDCEILFVDLGVLLEGRDTPPWHSKLLYNLLVLSSQKNLAWSNRVLCISGKGIRTRVMTYLSGEAVRAGSTEFTVPFNRQQMADYLNVERSALSKELARMQREGIIAFKKNRFWLNRPAGEDG